MMPRGFQAPLSVSQLGCHEIFLHVASDGTLASGSEGYGEATVVRNSDGNYTITLVTPGQRIVCPRAPLAEGVAGLAAQISSLTVTGAAVTVIFDDDGTPTDTEFWMGIVISDDLQSPRI